jgi:outer membrane protein TolC
MLNAENTLLTAREQMASLIANSTIQRVTLLLSVGGGFNSPAEDPDAKTADAGLLSNLQTLISKD